MYHRSIVQPLLTFRQIDRHTLPLISHNLDTMFSSPSKFTNHRGKNKADLKAAVSASIIRDLQCSHAEEKYRKATQQYKTKREEISELEAKKYRPNRGKMTRSKRPSSNTRPRSIILTERSYCPRKISMSLGSSAAMALLKSIAPNVEPMALGLMFFYTTVEFKRPPTLL